MSILNFFGSLFNFANSEQNGKTISQKKAEIQFKSLRRKQLTSLLLDTESKYEALKVDQKEQQRLVEEKRVCKEDLQNQLTRQVLNDLHTITNGNLHETLEETGCVVGFMTELINDLINDLKESLYELPASHNLVQKYHIVKPTNIFPQKTSLNSPPISRTEFGTDLSYDFFDDDTVIEDIDGVEVQLAEFFYAPKIMVKKKNISQKSSDSIFSSLSRDQLISRIVTTESQCESVKVEIENLRNLAASHKSTHDDLFQQMFILVDKLKFLSREGDFDQGDLRNLPKSTHDILRCIADQINLLVCDLQQALKELAKEHRLVKKYKYQQ